MNRVIAYIEDHLTEDIRMEAMASIVGCSTYEFSRIFSFMTGMPVSDYIRRRRLTQAVFDIQNGNGRIIDVALKYGYESPGTFSRAFKELHGQTPLSARKSGVSLKTYPQIAFKLTIRGVNEMRFRMETKPAFQIIGFACGGDSEDWRSFMKRYNARLLNGEGPASYYQAPYWQVGAYKFSAAGHEPACIIGAELGDKPALDGMDVEGIPAALWAVFTITSKTGFAEAGEAYARIMTEWFPVSGYKRNQQVPSLEVYGPGDANSDAYEWEVWMPMLNK